MKKKIQISDPNKMKVAKIKKIDSERCLDDLKKGEHLGVLLDKADTLHKQMNQIFLKQGLTTPDLTLLSPADKEAWYSLYEQSKGITDEICKLING